MLVLVPSPQFFRYFSFDLKLLIWLLDFPLTIDQSVYLFSRFDSSKLFFPLKQFLYIIPLLHSVSYEYSSKMQFNLLILPFILFEPFQTLVESKHLILTIWVDFSVQQLSALVFLLHSKDHFHSLNHAQLSPGYHNFIPLHYCLQSCFCPKVWKTIFCFHHWFCQ